MRPVQLAAALVLALTACSGDGEPASSRSTTTSTTVEAASTSAVTSTTNEAPNELEPLDLAISIHAEGFDDRNRDVYRRHLAALETVAAEAEAAGIIFTFELGRPFADGALAADDGWVARLPSRGQAVGVHADLGFPALPPRQFERRLREHKELVESLLGAPVDHVSGVCSEGPWVEPIIAAGFAAATGMVEYCLKSLDSIPAGYDADAVAACRTPADCHGQAPTDLDRKLHPWRTSTSADWLTKEPNGALWLIAGESGTGLPDTAEEFAAIVADYVAAREPGRSNSLVFAWSIGTPPTPGFVTSLAASVLGMADSIRWVSVADLAR